MFVALPTLYDSRDPVIFRFQETSAPWRNTGRGGTIDLAPNPAATIPPSSTTGHTGNAVSFGGTRVHRNELLSNGSDLGTRNGETYYTVGISARLSVFLRDYQASNYGGMLQKHAASPSDNSTVIQINYPNDSTGHWFVGLDTTLAGNFFYGPGVAIPLNTWTAIGFSYDGSFLRLYQNGSLIGSPQALTGRVNYVNHGGWYVGGSQSGFDTINGIINEARVSHLVQPASWFSLV